MECIYPGCGKEGSHETSTWNVGALCVAHYQGVKKTYLDKGEIPPDVLKDFVKVHVLLQFNTSKCLECINKLGGEMIVAKTNAAGNPNDPRFLKGNAGDNYLKLSRALEYYEGYCWFPANRVMFTGVLKDTDFYKYVKYGFNKDPGAGPIHGDQTHRLQWHVIMRCMTDNFTKPVYTSAGWKHSPLGLFYEYTQGAGTKTGAWAKSMDKRENAGWGNPDRVAYSINKSGNAIINEALSRRMEKMGGVNIVAVDRGTPFENAQKPGKIHSDLVGVLGPRVQEIGPVMGEYAKMKTRSGLFHRGTYKAQQDVDGKAINVLIKRDAPDKVVEINQDLVNQSKTGFNKKVYGYGSRVGAQPVDPQRW